MSEVRVLRGRVVPEMTVFVPCGRCGKKRDTAGVDLLEPGLAVRLCEGCLVEMIDAVRGHGKKNE